MSAAQLCAAAGPAVARVDALGMDPAGGQPVTNSRGTDGRLTYRGASDYKLSEVLLLDRR